jgi:uncharacterized membrane protein YkgB
MVTLQGFALIAELIAAAWLIIALASFGINRSKSGLVGSAIAFMVLIVTVTIIIHSST